MIPRKWDAMMGKVDVAAMILDLASSEILAQDLKAKVDISSKSFGEQLRTLESRKLVRISGGERKVRITKRGSQFLDLYNSIHTRYLTVPA